MLSEEEQYEIQKLSNENPQFGTIVKRLNEESKFMLSKISHEIRNPLTLINSTLQLLEAKNPEVQDIKYWDQITSDVNDLMMLLDDLSKFNNCEKLKLSNVNLYELITEIKNSFHTEAKNRNIDFTIHIKKGVRFYFENYLCDPIKMKQVFVNITKNAFDAVGENGKIEIKLDKLNQKHKNINSFLQISISNNGTPIPEEDIDSIFVPFITYKSGGTGLGLAIVSNIISAHKGMIQVDSNITSTTFHILLPLTND